MRILLDTHVFLWLTTGDPRLTPKTRAMLDDARAIFVSAASIWEISIKVRLGKLRADPSVLVEEMQANGFVELPVSALHAKEVVNLPPHHGDPFDRLLVGQAIVEQLRLFTADSHLAAYSELVVII
ncbi:type II toxin-antitoxin system VapC family toxin [Acidicapsa dinghuensis]|uniref:Type II toxin-antitoxin system VapC family toxin n=1 Tax=Acidicapsa dinghuensis TaxID=2218256 RepID=A0ABW1EL60_9BACT|nr:type II toxin-antitoxin system VapC family toxin [Acidicapsa dinghuensis]